MSATLFEVDPPVSRAAIISPCGLYRYRLTRTWGDGPTVCFVMLNPSTANGTSDDNTLETIIRFARRWGFGGLVVVNLYAYRATKPKAMWDADRKGVDIAGNEFGSCDHHIREAVAEADLVVCGWGNHGRPGLGENTIRSRRNREVLAMIREAGKVPHCLKITGDGQPIHPLYQPGDLVPFPMEAAPDA